MGKSRRHRGRTDYEVSALVAKARRNLRFDSLSQVMPDVERLINGHITIGRWSLGQILNHLQVAFSLSMDGTPQKRPWPVRRLFGPLAKHLSLRLGWIPPGVWMPSAYLPPAGLDAQAEAQLLQSAIARFGQFTGECDEHPLLGRLSLKQWQRFHCLHCAHHLSFAILQSNP